MKKSYKPLDRRSSRVFVPNCDNMDVDEYWKAANNELDETNLSFDFQESSIGGEPRLYKKSFDKEYANDGGAVEITGISESEAGVLSGESNFRTSDFDPAKYQQEGENAENVRANEIIKEVFGENSDCQKEDPNVEYEYDNISFNKSSDSRSDFRHRNVGMESAGVNASASTCENVDRTSTLVDCASVGEGSILSADGEDAKTSARDPEGSREGSAEEVKKTARHSSMKERRIRIHSGGIRKRQPKGRKPKSEAKRRKKTEPGVEKRRGETTQAEDSFWSGAHREEKHTGKNRDKSVQMFTLKGEDDVFGVNNLKYYAEDKSRYCTVVNFENLEAGVLFLKKHAQIMDERTRQNTVVCVLRGKVEVEVEHNKFLLGSGGLITLKKGWVYSMLSVSENGAVLNMVTSE